MQTVSEAESISSLGARLAERLRSKGYGNDPGDAPATVVAQSLCDIFGSSVRVVLDADDGAIGWLPPSIRSFFSPPELHRRPRGDTKMYFWSTEVCRWEVRIRANGDVSCLVLPVL